MIKLKKIMALGLSALMVTSLVGCGGTTNATENKKSDSSKGTEITFWNSFTGADGDMLVKMVDKFNKENKDGIKVKMDISSDFDSQLSTAFAAGEGPTMILSSSAYRFTYGDYSIKQILIRRILSNHIWIIVQMMTKRILYHFR